MKVYSVYDVVREDFAPPFVAKNDKEASRMFLQGIKRMPNPDDLSLWFIGDFFPEEQEGCVIVGCKPVQVPVEVGGSDEG